MFKKTLFFIVNLIYLKVKIEKYQNAVFHFTENAKRNKALGTFESYFKI